MLLHLSIANFSTLLFLFILESFFNFSSLGFTNSNMSAGLCLMSVMP